jgi:hypothetical protein
MGGDDDGSKALAARFEILIDGVPRSFRIDGFF